jgi:predicted AAA+ superfamily ATPase
MKIDKEELVSIISQFNPWWRNDDIDDLPTWERASFGELYTWITAPPVARAVMISGARQIGKTTLLMQSIHKLIQNGVPPENILYATFDHPILKLAGIDAVIDAWRTRQPKQEGKEFVFLDEVQFIKEWGTWIKHQVDFNKGRQIIFTGSALPLIKTGQESGVGRWHTIRLTTLSFFEYIRLKNIPLPKLPEINSFQELFHWPASTFLEIAEKAHPYIPHFHHYLIRGGFPQTAGVDTITHAQKLLREDIIDKVLKRDMTALFGVRHILDLEHTFLYLCLNDGGILDMQVLCKNLELKRPTAQNFIDLLESTHLIYRLQPFGYGKEVLRGKFKTYLSDASIAPAVLLKGQSILDDPIGLSVAAESCVLKHLFARNYPFSTKFSYWRHKENREVDLIAESNNQVIPFEVKYRSDISQGDFVGLKQFCSDKHVSRGYIITKFPEDIGILTQWDTPILRIPAALLCYWIGEMELKQSQDVASSEF